AYADDAFIARGRCHVPRVFGPDPIAHSEPAARRRNLRVRFAGGVGSAAAESIPAPGISAEGRAGEGAEGRAVVLLHAGPGTQCLPRQAAGLSRLLLQGRAGTGGGCGRGTEKAPLGAVL